MAITSLPFMETVLISRENTPGIVKMARIEIKQDRE